MRSSVLFQCLVAGLFSVVGHAAEPPAVEPGMTPQQVLAVLGEPDRIAVFEGKYLRDVPLEVAEGSNAGGSFVFIYRDRNLNVWFEHGRATGLMTGGSPLSNATGAVDHN